jgi:GxxExxY protein
MLNEGITKGIIGAAMTVLNELKPGLDVKLYENALVIELRARGIRGISSASIQFTIVAC